MAEPGGQIAGLPRGAAGLVAGLGAFAVLAQTILFRAFFDTFEGSEFGVAVFFASWLAWVAAGAALARPLASRIGAWPRLASLALFYVPAAAVQLVLIARARDLAGVSAHDIFPVLRMLPAAFIVNAPVSLLTGFLFTAACAAARGTPGAAARVYALEAAGGCAGGAAVTALLAAGATDERTFLLGAAGLALCTLRAAGGARRAAAPAAMALGCLAAIAGGVDGRWTRAADARAWGRLLPAGALRGRFATPQAVYRFGERDGAWIVQSRESIVETLPADAHAAEIAALHLAAAPHAGRVLVIGPGSLGIAQSLLRVSIVREIVWLPPDPHYAAAWLDRLPEGLRPDPSRFRAPGVEIRAFLAEKGPAFDLIVLHVPDPVGLPLNRLVSEDFLRLARNRLAEGGVVGLRMSGGENYLGPELARLGASMLTTAESVFRHVLLKPGDESWLFMTDRMSDFAPPDRMSRLYAAIPGSEALAPGEVVRAAFPAGRAEAQLERYRTVQERAAPGTLLNRDARPLALSAALAIGLKHSGARAAAAVWPGAVRPAAWALVLGLALLAALRCAARWRRRDPKAAAVPAGDIALLAAAAGAAGMASSVLLMCAYQTLHGGLFLHAGLLSALFMLGLWGGTAAARATLVRGRSPASVLLPAIVLHAAALAVFAVTGAAWSRAGFAAAFAIAGALGGLYVPAAAALLAARGHDDASTGAWIEILDPLGGAAGSLAAGLLVLPALGFAGTAGFVGTLALLALPAALPFATAARRPCDDAADVVLRRTGLAAGWLLVCALVFSAAWRADRSREGGDPLVRAAREMAPDAILRRSEVALPGGRTAPCHVAGPEDAPEDYFLSTAAFGARVQGYGGTLDLALRIGRDGTLRDLRVIAARETPRYFARLDHWFQSLHGLKVADPEARRNIDGVSGATVSAGAVVQAIFSAGPVFCAAVLSDGPGADAGGGPIAIPRATLLLALFAAAAAVLRRFSARAQGRRLFLIAVVAVFGLWLNTQVSLVHVRAWIDTPWPRPSWGLSFVLPFAVPLLVLLGGNLYCGWLCPFGALQELVLALRPKRWRTEPPAAVLRWGRYVKYAVLAAAGAVWAVRPAARLFDVDPLTVAFSGEASRGVALLVLGVLAASWLVPRFWCRVLCPSGAFLSIVSALRPAEALWPRVRPRRCDLGVRARNDLDCLGCDRCRSQEAASAPGTFSPWRKTLFATLCAVSVGALAALAGSTLVPPVRSDEPSAGPAPETGTELSADQMRQIRSRMQEGRLSAREALYYAPLTNAPADPGGGRHRRGQGRDGR